MLIEFSVANFRSFREMQTLRLQAAPIKSRNPQLDEQNVFQVNEKLSLVKSKVIYGANASGKSNLVKAMAAFVRIFHASFQEQDALKKWIEPYLLNKQSFQQPTFFQVQFRINERNYRYGFEANQISIISEWLYSSNGSRMESYHFKREGQQIEINPRTFKEASRLIIGKDELPPLYRDNALFLPLVAAFNGPIAETIVRYFTNNLIIYSGLDSRNANATAMHAFQDDAMRAKMVSVLKRSDVGIEDLDTMEIPDEGLNEITKGYFLKQQAEGKKPILLITKRKAVDEKGEAVMDVPFLFNEESYGTQKLFFLSPFLINALETGGALVVDEFGSSLHVKLIRAILDLFHSPITNPHNAQLIVATHDTHLLDQRIFRRDQIAFVEKDKSGQSVLTDLVEFKGVRNDASLENDYLNGRYGAVPLINQFDWAFTPENHGQEN